MSKGQNPLVKLQDLQHYLAAGTLEESLTQQAAMTAALVGAATCSVMLLNTGEGEDMRMSMYARYGDQPAAALAASVARGEGIAGSVLASGDALCLADIGASDYAGMARRRDGAPGSLMCAPVRIDGRIVGVLNAANPPDQPPFGDTELRLLEVVALFIGKAIQVQQLQHLLDSRFAQLALLHEARHEGAPARTAYRNPEGVARILARSFFREMTKAGFESAQIVGAASELIDQLHHQLQHEKKSKPEQK
jgi:L-methionine (R)-S-oxide reductase